MANAYGSGKRNQVSQDMGAGQFATCCLTATHDRTLTSTDVGGLRAECFSAAIAPEAFPEEEGTR
jgi:hypothetical protein